MKTDRTVSELMLAYLDAKLDREGVEELEERLRHDGQAFDDFTDMLLTDIHRSEETRRSPVAPPVHQAKSRQVRVR